MTLYLILDDRRHAARLFRSALRHGCRMVSRVRRAILTRYGPDASDVLGAALRDAGLGRVVIDVDDRRSTEAARRWLR